MPGQDSGRDRQTVNHSTTGKSGVARENSAFQLIADTSNGGKMKCKVLQKTRKSILTVILVCAIGVLCTMTALYISERQRRVEMASVNTQKEELKQVGIEFRRLGRRLQPSIIIAPITYMHAIHSVFDGCILHTKEHQQTSCTLMLTQS